MLWVLDVKLSLALVVVVHSVLQVINIIEGLRNAVILRVILELISFISVIQGFLYIILV